MKKIASLFAAGICLMAVALPVAALEPRWGWSDLKANSWTLAWTELAKQDGASTRKMPGPTPAQVAVVALPVDPGTVAARALAGALPVIEDAMRSLRQAVATSPALASTLKAKGYAPDDVVGVNRTQDGTVTVLVGKAA